MTTTVTEEGAKVIKVFKLIGGPHYENHPNFELNKTKGFGPLRSKKYVKGDLIESDRDLVTIYPNKFEEAIPGVNVPIVVTVERKKMVARMIENKEWQEEDRDFLEKLTDKDMERLQKRFNPPTVKTGPKEEAEKKSK